MTREAKVGLMMVALLVGVFGFLLYKRIHRPAEALAEQTTESPDSSIDGNGVNHSHGNENPRTKRHRGIERDEFAERTVEKFVDESAEDANPFANERPKRAKTPLPRELPSDDDDFTQLEPPKRGDAHSHWLEAPDPSDDTIDNANVQRTPQRWTTPSDSEIEPFSDVDKASSIRKVQFEEPANDQAIPELADDESTPRRRRPGSARESESAFENVERTAERVAEDVFEDVNPSRNGQRSANSRIPSPAPMPFSDDGFSTNSRVQQAGATDGQTYTIQPNDNFWSISRKRYGAGRYYKALALHNRQTISDPQMMKPGVMIATPDASVLEQRYADVIPKAAPANTTQSVSTNQSIRTAVSEPSGYFVADDGVPMYRIGEQDTLTGIAKSHLGRTSRWVQIFEMNRNVLRDGNELKIGMVLRLPADASRVQIVRSMRDVR